VQGLTKTSSGEFELSLYDDRQALPETVAKASLYLQRAFPKMEEDFFNILSERILANKFTEERLRDAVRHVVDNFHYKELNVADIVSYDRRVKLYTGAEFMNAQMNGTHCSKFEKRVIDGEIFWVLKSDLIKAGIK
jgi:hypothetical protein